MMVNKIEVKNIDGKMSIKPQELKKLIQPDAENVISFEKGIYYIGMDETQECYLTPNADRGIKNVVFCFDGVKDLEIDANGAEFVFCDRMFPFALKDSENITLKNFSIDFSFERYCQGKLTESDETGFVLEIPGEEFKVDVDDEGHIIFWSGSYCFSSEDILILLANEVFGKSPWDYIFAGDSKCSKQNLPAGMIETDAVRIDEDHIRFNYRKDSQKPVYNVGENLLFCYEPRDNVNIFADDCKVVRLENINIYRGGGMGVVTQMCDDVYMENVCIQIKPGRSACRSTTADGMYIVQCAGTVSVNNCRICDTLDDALNIHGLYTKVLKAVSATELEVGFVFEDYKDFVCYKAGDTIVISDGNGKNKAQAKVLSVEKADAVRQVIRLDAEVSAAEGDVIENISRRPDFVFENNYVEGCPHIRASGTKSAAIVNNEFYHLFRIFVNDLLEYWGESGCVDGMKICNNTFFECPGSGDAYPIHITTTRPGSDFRHKNIEISGNSFTNDNKKAIFAEYVDDLVIKDNVYNNDNAVDIENCTMR